jgi:hypothetical protein
MTAYRHNFKWTMSVDGEPIDLRLLPQEIMYNQLGAEWIADRLRNRRPFFISKFVKKLQNKVLNH